jgi:hypothetical protein
MADEVSRLREALERIANGVWPIGGYDDMTGADHMRNIARAALATATTKGG